VATANASRNDVRESGDGGARDRQRGDRRGEVERYRKEAERYRRAAEDALQQLDWCIGYLHGIRKTQISRALSRNRSFIRTQLMGVHEQALPPSNTDES
jgi:hypothetical protein